jgi:hypothetical protein
MDNPVMYAAEIQAALQHYVDTPSGTADVTTILMVSADGCHFSLIVDGWQGAQHINYCAVHVESRAGQVLIHQDRTDSLIEELRDAGIPAERIVLAYQPPAPIAAG